MYLIVGLGNPENDYSGTRHNMGFDVINKLSEDLKIEMNKMKFKGIYGKGEIEGEKVILLKPQTYMNLSGESVIEWKNFYKLENNKIIVISDDIDLEPGNIRIRKKGGPGTHNGLKSIVSILNAEDFIRVRVGVGKPLNGSDLIEYVIGFIPEDERNTLDIGIEKAKRATLDIIKKGIDNAMNLYN